jgi:Skp family chaperone for outer membrane proteins
MINTAEGIGYTRNANGRQQIATAINRMHNRSVDAYEKIKAEIKAHQKKLDEATVPSEKAARQEAILELEAGLKQLKQDRFDGKEVEGV